jgi:hypothetical protein
MRLACSEEAWPLAALVGGVFLLGYLRNAGTSNDERAELADRVRRARRERWAARIKATFVPGRIQPDDWLRVSLLFHQTNLTELLRLPYGERRSFEPAECADSIDPLCVPRHLVQWQRATADALPRDWPPRWSTCAVIGSSNSIMHEANGRLIDSAAAVRVRVSNSKLRCGARRASSHVAADARRR